ncbi:MAG: hypothetical protein ACYSUD_03225, partial [Planctomycetota bacterium]
MIERWKEESCPQWDYETTEKVCLEEDQTLAEEGDNPAPGFRERVALVHESNIRCSVLPDNRFNKLDVILAYLFPASYSKLN